MPRAVPPCPVRRMRLSRPHARRYRRHPSALPRRAQEHGVQANCASGIVQSVREAVEQYGMIGPGAREGEKPKWLVCLSGGKDSYTLLAVLHELQWRGMLPVELLACNLDQGQPGFPATVLPEFLEECGVPHRIEYQDTYSVVIDKIPQGRTFCALCSRLRRGPSLPDRARGRLLGGRARPSPRRHPRDLLHEPLPRRAARDDAAETGERGGRPLPLSPARPCGRGRLREIRQAR